jgi:hypothetical protein
VRELSSGGHRAGEHRLALEHGIAMIIALLATALMSAVAVAVVLTTTTETRIAANYRRSTEALYAAESIVELSLADLAAVADWNRLLDGSARSTFTDGAPDGRRALPDGSTIDLVEVVNMANCAKPTACTDADMDAITDDRPWGANNPRWTLFAYGRLQDVLPAGAIDSPFYVVLLVGDDPAETDNDPMIDGGGENNPGRGAVALRGEAFGPGRAHRAVEAVAARGARGVRLTLWRDAR